MEQVRLLLGLDIGGTKCAALIGDDLGVVHERREWASNAERGPDAMIGDLVRHARDLMDAHRGVAACGVSVGGPMNAETGVILSPPNLPGWDEIPLRDRLSQTLRLPVRVEHDAAACVLAEHCWGAARGASPAASTSSVSPVAVQRSR